MKNKLIIRILGAFASALVIASVFIPFVSVTGYSQSLWQANVSTLYLPIMILVFGGISTLVFAINRKVELAFASTGALLFFLIMQTIPIIDQGAFGSLSVGYYCLAVGTVLMGVLAFLASVKPKQKELEKIEVSSEESKNSGKEDTMLNQIDKLYNNETVQSNSMEITQLETVQPLSSDSTLSPIQPLSNEIPLSPIQPIVNTSNETVLSESTQAPAMEMPVIEQQKIEPISTPIVAEEISMLQQPTMDDSKKENIALKDLTSGMPSIETVEDKKVEPANENINPVVAEFSTPVEKQNSILSKTVLEPKKEETVVEEMPIQAIEPLATTTPDLLANNNQPDESNNANLDIFG